MTPAYNYGCWCCRMIFRRRALRCSITLSTASLQAASLRTSSQRSSSGSRLPCSTQGLGTGIQWTNVSPWESKSTNSRSSTLSLMQASSTWYRYESVILFSKSNKMNLRIPWFWKKYVIFGVTWRICRLKQKRWYVSLTARRQIFCLSRYVG